ncbi:hypothetical protein Scep_029565 [Stephania cephalantha]|uniref:Exocyst component Exo84 C-terminal domain-containing protein n=1 Tax=Stephania cephalantha TaxID=152367 RepID=A0AAP0E5K2_9MAGN
MDSSTRFRFRDAETSSSSSSSSSASVDSPLSRFSNNGDFEPQSMTAKGIKLLCSELIELKTTSNDDFHRTVYLNCPDFVRIFKELRGIEYEMKQLKLHVSNHKKLINELMDGVYMEVLSEEFVDSIFMQFEDVDQSSESIVEVQIDAIPEVLDVLLSEQRLDEALTIVEKEMRLLKKKEVREDSKPHSLTSYYTSILERKSRLANQYAALAEHPRVPSPEFLKALAGLCRLGDSQHAIQLLLRYYHSRLENAKHELQWREPSLDWTYIRQLAKAVFSTISQAARSFENLFGDKSPYASEFVQWACEETEAFVSCFDKYIKSLEINVNLAPAVDAVNSALSYCSILETQWIVLKPYLIKLLCPCMEEVLEMYICHYKKIIGVFAASDAWILDKYLISEILMEVATPAVISKEVEFCFLTTSGRKFITTLQVAMKESFPLVFLQIDTAIFNGLMDLFSEYINILDKAISGKADVSETGGSIIIQARTMKQQLSVLANASAVVDIFSSATRNILKGTKQFGGEIVKDHLASSLEKKLVNWIFFIQEAANRPKASFCQQFISRVTIPEIELKLKPEFYINYQSSDVFHDLMPSVAFEMLFQELRNVDKLGKEVYNGANWLLEELLTELMANIFLWLSSNEDFWKVIEENSTLQHSDGFWKISLIILGDLNRHNVLAFFALDVQFLVELSRFGGYFCDNLGNATSALISRMESAFIDGGVDLCRNEVDYGRIIDAATKSILKLLGKENRKSSSNEAFTIVENSDGPQYVYESDPIVGRYASSEDNLEMDEGLATNTSEIVTPIVQAIHELDQTTTADETQLDEARCASSNDSTTHFELEEAVNDAMIKENQSQKSEISSAKASSMIAKEVSGDCQYDEGMTNAQGCI